MKKRVLILVGLFILSLSFFAQNNLNLVIFSEDGDLFFAYVNGIRQNDSPQSNVKITNLTSPNISLRIEFNDKTLPQLKQNMALELGYEHTAKIKRDMKKQLKLRYFGQTPLSNSSSPEQNTVAYHTAENPMSNNSQQVSSGTANTTITSSTITTSQSYNGSDPSVNINMGGVGISMNVSGMDPNGTTMNTTTSTTVTNSSYSSGSATSNYNESESADNTTAVKNTGCVSAMGVADFDKMKKSVEAKPFSDTKMSTAKVATKNACLSVSQVKEICKLFNMDEEKLAYAQFAYDHCVNKANYYQVSEVFSFSSTTDDFNKFLEDK